MRGSFAKARIRTVSCCGAIVVAACVDHPSDSNPDADAGAGGFVAVATGGMPMGGASPGGRQGVGGSSAGVSGANSAGGFTGAGGLAGEKDGGVGGVDPASGGVGGAANGGAAGTANGGSAGTANGGSAGAMGGGTGGSPSDLCDAGVWDGSAPEILNLTGNTFAHDPTMIELNGVFYRFWTGHYVPSASSTDLLHWNDENPIYTAGYSSWVNEWLDDIPAETFNFPWAPDVSSFNGNVHLYSSFSARFGDNISCITHLTTNDIASGNWTDHGPIICTEGDEDYNAIDADVGFDEDGTPWLAFGSFWDGIMVFELNPDGSRAAGGLTRLAWAPEIEAPVLLRRCGYYYLFVTWGLCCPGENRTIEQLSYRVAVGRSESIWGPYLDRNGTPMLEGGGTLLVEGDGVTWAAAGHSDVVVRGDTIYHFYHAYRQSNGAPELRIVEMPFDDEGWPVRGGP